MRKRYYRMVPTLVVMLVGLSAAVTLAEDAALQALSPERFKAMLDQSRNNADVVVLDIRTPREFEAGHIEGAILIDYYASDFVDRLRALDRQKTYLIYCRSGNRTGKSLSIFKQLGFERVFHLETGLVGWVKADYPLVRSS